MKRRSAIKTDLFADTHHRDKLDILGAPPAEIDACIDFAALSMVVDRIAPRPDSLQSSRPPSAVPDRDHGAYPRAQAVVQPV